MIKYNKRVICKRGVSVRLHEGAFPMVTFHLECEGPDNSPAERVILPEHSNAVWDTEKTL